MAKLEALQKNIETLTSGDSGIARSIDRFD